MTGTPTLLPLPGGGVLVRTRHRMVGISSGGERLWEQEALTILLDWALLEDQLLLAVAGQSGSIWTIDAQGATAWEAQAGICFALATVDGQVFAYDKQGIVRLDPQTRSTELWYALPDGFPGVDDLVALPGGGLLATHTDAPGGSLIALRSDGTLRWQRSHAHLGLGAQRLLVLDGRPYLVPRYHGGAIARAAYEVDVENAALTKVFDGGARDATSADAWISAIGEGRMLINLGSTAMLALDARSAGEAIRGQ